MVLLTQFFYSTASVISASNENKSLTWCQKEAKLKKIVIEFKSFGDSTDLDPLTVEVYRIELIITTVIIIFISKTPL